MRLVLMVMYYKDKTAEFLIIRNSSKMQNSTFNSIDVNNNIVISSNNANYPTDTVVSSNIIKNDDLLKNLGLSNAQIIDIDLYSPTVGKINNFDNVDFDVKVPINEDLLNGEKLYAYYIDENGNIEEHPVVIDDFIANFKTNHFSTYIIGEKTAAIDKLISETKKSSINENNPNTKDNIIKWITLLCMSVIGVVGCTLFYKKSSI